MIAARLARLWPAAARRQMTISKAFCTKRRNEESEDDEESVVNRNLEKEYKDEILTKDLFTKYGSV